MAATYQAPVPSGELFEASSRRTGASFIPCPAAPRRYSVGTAHAHVTAVTGLLAERTPGLPRNLQTHDPEFVQLNGTLAQCDRVGDGDGRADWSTSRPRTTGTSNVTPEPLCPADPEPLPAPVLTSHSATPAVTHLSDRPVP